MGKWLGIICLTCASQGWAADARFMKPTHFVVESESRLDRYVKRLESSYKKLRTLKETESSCWLLDYKKKGVWLRFERNL